MSLIKKSPQSHGQVLFMTDEKSWWIVSVADTSDNWRETAINYKGKWFIKMWDYRKSMGTAKTIEEAKEIWDNIPADLSCWSD